MSEQEKPYYAGHFDDAGYHPLYGPDGFESTLTEPEDRNWYRDGARVVDELNRLHTRLRAAEERADGYREAFRHWRKAENDTYQAWRAIAEEAEQERDAALATADRHDECFREGTMAGDHDWGQEADTPCPYPEDSPERHWWTRGYSYQARLLRAGEAEGQRDAAMERERALREALARVRTYLAAVVRVDERNFVADPSDEVHEVMAVIDAALAQPATMGRDEALRVAREAFGHRPDLHLHGREVCGDPCPYAQSAPEEPR